MRNAARHHRQQGAVILTVCLALLFLLGFIGLALDFGRAFVIKTELQTAMDSCALSAAQELDGAADAITRAASAGVTAGNSNRVYFQSVNWQGEAQLTASDLTFLDANYIPTTDGTSAKYVQCMHTQPNVQMLLMSALGFFFHDSATYPGMRNVAASAVAKRSSAQTTCPLPVALVAKSQTGPNYGFNPGEWITMLVTGGSGISGEIGWANLDGSTNAAETAAEMNGKCATRVGDTLRTPGVQSSIVDVWNYRFGIYKNNGDPSVTYERPDFTGYAYTAKNWPSKSNAFSGPIPVGAGVTADSFVNKRLAFASCADTGTQVKGSPTSCEGINNPYLSLNGFTKLAAPGMTAGGHRQYGTNRRIVLVPLVFDPANMVVKDYACMLILQPLSIPMQNVQLEYIGNAGAPNSPCTTNGIPGGAAGPLVPVLVR